MSDKKLKTVPSTDKPSTQKVVSLTDARAKKNAADRRKMERHFLTEMVQVFCEMDPKSIFPVPIIDTSEKGCSFRIPFDAAEKLGIRQGGREDFTLRFYMSKDTYMPVRVRIANLTPYVEEGGKYFRVGCEVDQSLKSYGAYQELVRFLDLFSQLARTDRRSAVI